MRLGYLIVTWLLAACAGTPGPGNAHTSALPAAAPMHDPAMSVQLERSRRERIRQEAAIATPTGSSDVELRKRLMSENDAYVACSLKIGGQLALQPENPALIAITATTLCGTQARDLRAVADMAMGNERSGAFMHSAEVAAREHVVAFVVAMRANARQQEQQSPTDPQIKKGQDI
jgi:hypothetical protein